MKYKLNYIINILFITSCNSNIIEKVNQQKLKNGTFIERYSVNNIDQETIKDSIINIFIDTNNILNDSIIKDLNFIVYSDPQPRVKHEVQKISTMISNRFLVEAREYFNKNKTLYFFDQNTEEHLIINVSKENKLLGYVTFNTNINKSIKPLIYKIDKSQIAIEMQSIEEQFEENKNQMLNQANYTNISEADLIQEFYNMYNSLHNAPYYQHLKEINNTIYKGKIIAQDFKPKLEECLYIDILLVDPKTRKSGYASQLMNHLEKVAKFLDKRYLLLYTWNKEGQKEYSAYNFYKKRGFKVWTEEKTKTKQNTVYLYKDLESM